MSRPEGVEAALQSELQGPGQLLGYRSVQRKIREQYQLAAPRNLVYDLMTELDPDGLEQRESVPVKVTTAPLLCFLFPILGTRKQKRGAAGTFTGTLPLCSRPSGFNSLIKSWTNFVALLVGAVPVSCVA